MAKRELTEEQRAQMRANLAKAREAAKAKRAAKDAAILAAPATEIDKGVVPHSVDLSVSARDDHDNEQAPVGAGAALLASERRARLLEGVDPDIAKLISDAELDEMEAEERKRALDERKKLALTTARAALRQKAQIEHDLISADVLLSEAEKKARQQPVKFRVIVANEGAGHNQRSGMRVNGYLYEHGKEHTRPRCVAESVISNMWAHWLWETRFKTLDQHKPGNSAEEIMNRSGPRFVVEMHDA